MSLNETYNKLAKNIERAEDLNILLDLLKMIHKETTVPSLERVEELERSYLLLQRELLVHKIGKIKLELCIFPLTEGEERAFAALRKKSIRLREQLEELDAKI